MLRRPRNDRLVETERRDRSVSREIKDQRTRRVTREANVPTDSLHSFRRTCQRYGGWRGTAPSPCLDPRNPHHTTETSLRYTVLSSPLRRGRLSPSLAPFALPVQFAATHIKTHPHRDPNS